MARLAARELARLRELDAYLRAMPERAPPAMPAVLEELRGLLDGVACAYDWQMLDAGLRVGALAFTGIERSEAEVRTAMDRHSAAGTYGSLYDLARPEPRQRNVALTCADAERFRRVPRGSTRHNSVFVELGLGGFDQVRVLVCDGEALLGWVGGLRERDFGAREKQILDRLVPALRHRLGLERQLERASLTSAALAAVLEAISAPAFVCNRAGHVVHRNAAGAAQLDAAPGLAEGLRACARGLPSPFQRTRISAPGAHDHWLVLARATPGDTKPRLAVATTRWGLTPKQAEVLSHVARGDANKTVAARLGCAESTVELHVTALLAKAEAESRAQLVAKFWTLD